MDDADMITVEIQDNKIVLIDRISSSYGYPKPDSSYDGCSGDSYELLDSEISGDSYTAVFRRKFDTGDHCDRPIVNGQNNVLWASADSP